MKKSVSLMLALIIGASLFTGCGSSSKKETPEVEKSVTETSDIGEKTGEGEGKASWEEDTSDHTITWFFAYDWYNKKFDEKNNEFDKWVYEQTGCKLEIQTGDTDKLNMLIKTGKLPDVVTFDANSVQRNLLEDNGLVLPLNKLRDEYAPELIVPESMIDWYTNEDGNWYAIASFYYGDDNVKENNGFFETHNQNYVRDDILKQIGMTYDDLLTKEGFLNALRAVKEQGVEYNGTKVTPYMVLFGDRAAEQVAEQLGGTYEDKDGKYQSILKSEQYKEAMLLFNQMYREGLLTDDSFTVDKSQIEQEISAGHVFATTAKTNASVSRDSLYALDNVAKILYAGQFTGDNNNQVMVPAKNNMGWTGTLITKDAKKPERIIRLFDFLNQQETVLNNQWGMGAWELDDNGIVVLDPEYSKMRDETPTEFNMKYTGDLAWTNDYTIIQGTFPEDRGVWGDDVYQHTHDDRIIIYDDKSFSDVAPQSGSDEAATEARINEYKTQALGRIITASTADQCEKELEAALAEMESLGLSKLDAYKDKHFQVNKQKLGLKFAFPGHK